MTHRFYVGETKDKSGTMDLTHDLWINDAPLANQILKVLRMRSGEDLVLFNGEGTEVLYTIVETEQFAVHLQKKTDLVVKDPARKIILAWSLLKKDKNEWVLQKCTELGVTHFLPMITERTEKSDFDIERAHKIVVEAVEQCGRHTIPQINEPQSLQGIIGEYKSHVRICVADMDGVSFEDSACDEVLVLIGPEGGWSEKEKKLFVVESIPSIMISRFTLRAETASVSAVNLLSGI